MPELTKYQAGMCYSITQFGETILLPVVLTEITVTATYAGNSVHLPPSTAGVRNDFTVPIQTSLHLFLPS
jgi:hypothetical protein